MEKSKEEEKVKKLWEPYFIKDNNLTVLGTLCVLCFGIAMLLHPILLIIEKPYRKYKEKKDYEIYLKKVLNNDK